MAIKVTIYPNSKDKFSAYYVDTDMIYERIKNGNSMERIAELHKINREKEPDKYRDFKANKLPSICFSGIFKERVSEKIIKHTGLLAVDFDHWGID